MQIAIKIKREKNDLHTRSIIQSMNQSTNQLINQLINKLINQIINKHQSINQLFTQYRNFIIRSRTFSSILTKSSFKCLCLRKPMILHIIDDVSAGCSMKN